MKGQPKTLAAPKEHPFTAKIGRSAECSTALSAAIAKRAYEIYQRGGRLPGGGQENWHLAESEILQPLCCGILESEDEIIVSLFHSAVGGKSIQEIEVIVEPHRLILVGNKQSGSESGKRTSIYRVLPLREEFDPFSAKLRQRGSFWKLAHARSEGIRKPWPRRQLNSLCVSCFALKSVRHDNRNINILCSH
jgi:hypothetical protein